MLNNIIYICLYIKNVYVSQNMLNCISCKFREKVSIRVKAYIVDEVHLTTL